MATTITCEAMTGTGRMPRVSINGHQFIECEIMRGGGRMLDARIGSYEQVLNVKSWDPAQADAEVLHNHSVKVNVEALNTALLDVRRDEGGDFTPGTFSNVEVIGAELNLTTSPYIEDWEGVTPEDNWTSRFSHGEYGSVIDDGSGTNKVYNDIHWNNEILYTANDGPYASDVQVYTRWQIKNKWDAKICLAARITGSGTACRGYILTYHEDTGQVTLRRITGDGSTYQEGFDNSPGIDEVQEDEWCWMAYKVVGSGHYYKIWMEAESSEPVSWKWIATHGGHAGPGDVGIMTIHSSGNEVIWWDDFSAETVPPLYQTSGYWEGSDDVTSVDHYSHGLVSWIETTPTNTTVMVKIRWPGGTWQTCTNGAILPDIEYEQDMRAGSTKDTLEWRVELATTDTGVTPAVEDLRVYFEPGRQEEFELTVRGVSCVPDDGSLIVYGRALIGTSGTPPTLALDWSDLWAETYAWWLSRDLELIAAEFEYWGNAIGSITFEAEGSKFRHGHPEAYYTFPLTPYYSGPAHAEWTALTPWNTNGKVYEWVLTDKGLAIHADAKWICGHVQIDDNPGSLLAGLLILDDHVGSLIAKGYLLNDNVGMALVQGWRRDDQPGFVLPALEFFYDSPGGAVLSIRALHDQPGMFLVYGVNRDGSIFVNVIDDNTYQTLTDFGVTFS